MPQEKTASDAVCPHHGKELVTVPNPVGRGFLLVCPDSRCTEPAQIVRRARQPQLKMQFSNREAAQIVGVEREKPIQNRTIRRFEAHGYIVLETSEHRRKIQCMQRDREGKQVAGCGRWFTPPGGRGTDKAIPDLFVHHPSKYPPYLWIGIEMKGTDTILSPEQALLAAQNAIAVCRSDDEAWKAVQFVERILDPVLRAYQVSGSWLP